MITNLYEISTIEFENTNSTKSNRACLALFSHQNIGKKIANLLLGAILYWNSNEMNQAWIDKERVFFSLDLIQVLYSLNFSPKTSSWDMAYDIKRSLLLNDFNFNE